MSVLFGILKIVFVLTVDFAAVYGLFGDVCVASFVVGMILLYVLFGGYSALLKEGAVNSKKLPVYQRNRLETAKTQLIADVKTASGVNLCGVRFYMTPEEDMNAAAYGFLCVSVTRGILDNADSITLKAVLAHEVSHILNFDAEFNRALFCSATLLIGTLSALSLAVMTVIFLIFLVLRCFRSWFGVIAFQSTKRVIGGIFHRMQRGVAGLCCSLLSLVSRHAEYRSDKFSFMLGYGVQLAYFLSLTESNNRRPLTLTEAMYRSHPPTSKRIARLEKLLHTQNTAEIAKR